MSKYIGTRNERNTQIVALGVDAYLKMLLHDNFVHTDLHPGNILVRPRMEGPSQDSSAGSPGNASELLQLILLDFGLAEELTPPVRRHFISLLHMVGKGGSLPGLAVPVLLQVAAAPQGLASSASTFGYWDREMGTSHCTLTLVHATHAVSA